MESLTSTHVDAILSTVGCTGDLRQDHMHGCDTYCSFGFITPAQLEVAKYLASFTPLVLYTALLNGLFYQTSDCLVLALF